MADCEWMVRIEEMLLAGEEVEVFRHLSACDLCRGFGLGRGLFPPGCSAPILGHGILLYADLLPVTGEPSEEVPPHFGLAGLRVHRSECQPCRLAIERSEWLWVEAELARQDPRPDLPFVAYRVGQVARRQPWRWENGQY